MDIKSSISKAIEDNGFIDLRRLLKASNQLEYQPNQTKFNGSGYDQKDDQTEIDAYNLMMQKQRDIDNKSERLVTSSMETFKIYTQSQQQTADNKIRDLKQKNKILIDTIVRDADLHKKTFSFPLNDRNKSKEDKELRKKQLQMIKDDEEEQQGNAQENTKRQSSNKEPESQEQNQQVQPKEEQKEKFDFHQINNKAQSKKRENVINKQIGNLPREIQAIQDIVEEEQNLLPIYNDKSERSKVDIVQGDLLESFSMAYIYPKNSQLNSTHNLCFFRDLAPISRFLVKYTNVSITPEQRILNKQNEEFCNSELIQADEIVFDIKNLQYSNIADIVSGRIGDEQLAKYDTMIPLIEELPPKIQLQVQDLIKQQFDEQMKTIQIQQQQYNATTQQSEIELKKKQDIMNISLSKEQIQKQQKMKNSQESGFKIDISQNMSSMSPKNLSNTKSQMQQMTPDQKKMSQIMMTQHNQTDQILNKIGEIKSKKEDMKYLRDPQEQLSKYVELKKELKQALNGLLYMILKTENNPHPQINNRYSELEQQVNQLLQNLDKIQGTKTSDGHLKSVLLLTFLEEYKWIKQEDQSHNMDFNSSNNIQNKSQRQSNTSPNQFHIGQNKSNTKSFNNSQMQASHMKLNSQSREMDSSFNSNIGKNQKTTSRNQKSTNQKENISTQYSNQYTRESANPKHNKSQNSQIFFKDSSFSPNIRHGELQQIDMSNSFYQQTPVKRNNINTTSFTERSLTPNQGHSRNKSSQNTSFMKSQSALSNHRSISQINNRSDQSQNNKSLQSISSKSFQKSTKQQSKSPVISKNGIAFYDRNNSSQTYKKMSLSQMKIPGIKKGQNSIINNSYILNEFSDEYRPNTQRK